MLAQELVELVVLVVMLSQELAELVVLGRFVPNIE